MSPIYFEISQIKVSALLWVDQNTDAKTGQAQHKINLTALFSVQYIPKNLKLRDILDEIPSETLAPIFKEFLTDCADISI